MNWLFKNGRKILSTFAVSDLLILPTNNENGGDRGNDPSVTPVRPSKTALPKSCKSASRKGNEQMKVKVIFTSRVSKK